MNDFNSFSNKSTIIRDNSVIKILFQDTKQFPDNNFYVDTSNFAI